MSKFERLSNVDGAKIIQVVVVESIVGDGVKGSPVRTIQEYFSTEGELLARRDTWRDDELKLGIWHDGDGELPQTESKDEVNT